MSDCLLLKQFRVTRTVKVGGGAPFAQCGTGTAGLGPLLHGRTRYHTTSTTSGLNLKAHRLLFTQKTLNTDRFVSRKHSSFRALPDLFLLLDWLGHTYRSRPVNRQQRVLRLR